MCYMAKCYRNKIKIIVVVVVAVVLILGAQFRGTFLFVVDNTMPY